MAYTVPNAADAAFIPQARLFSADLVALSLGPALTGVQSGCVVTAQGTPDMTLAVASGYIRYNGARATVGAGNVTITAADVTNPRIDLVVVSSTGVKSVTPGTPSVLPIMPAIPASSIVLYAVYVPANDLAINANQIIDKRILIADPGYELCSWYGIIGDDATDNTTAFNTMLSSIPTASPLDGRTFYFPAGIYRFGSAIAINDFTTFNCKFVGLGGKPTSIGGGTVGNVGVIFRLTAGFRLFDFNAGALNADTANTTNGPTFDHIGFDGQSIAGTEAIRFRMCNRSTLVSCLFGRFANQAIQVDSAIDTVSGGDSSWHNWYDCTWYNNAIAVYARHTFGINIYGGDVVCYNAAYTGFKIDNPGGGAGNPSEHVHFYGVMFDGGNPSIDLNGAGYCSLYGCKFEAATIGVRFTHVGTSAISGSKNKIDGCAFGGVTTCFSVGTGCAENTAEGNHYTNCTNLWTFADVTAAKSTHRLEPHLWPPGNLPLETQRSGVPADADMVNEQFVMYGDFTAAVPRPIMKFKDAGGTAVVREMAIVVINAQTGTTYTLVGSDMGNMVTMNNAGAQTLTVPANATVAFPVGTQIQILSIGAGTVTVSAAGGVTLVGVALTITQYVRKTLTKTGTNVWVLQAS